MHQSGGWKTIFEFEFRRKVGEEELFNFDDFSWKVKGEFFVYKVFVSDFIESFLYI